MSFRLYIFVLFIPLAGSAQNKASDFNNSLQLSFGKSFHGTGDLRGFAYSTNFSRVLNRKFNLVFSLSGTLHDGDLSLYYGSGGNQFDGSVRYTVGGGQIGSAAGYNIIKTGQHELQLQAGVFLRYQSSSLPDSYVVLYPIITGLPGPVIAFNHSSPQRTFAPGLFSQLSYQYAISKRVMIGVLAGFQFDTEGDNLRQLALSGGFRF